MKLCCFNLALRCKKSYYIYYIEEAIRCICEVLLPPTSYVATFEYIVARILFPLKFVRGHFVYYKKLLNLWRIFHDVFKEHRGIAVMGTKAQRSWRSISFVAIRPRTLWRLSKFVTNNKLKILMFYMRKMGGKSKKKSWRPRIELGPSQGRRFELGICI